MIIRLLHRCSPTARRLLVVELTLIIATAVLQGIAFLLLVPLLDALFRSDVPSTASWLTVLAAVGLLYGATVWATSRFGMRASTAILESLLTRLGDRLVELPMSWFGADRSGLVSHLATHGAMVVATTPYSVIRLIVTGFVTPGVVLVGMYAVDWRLALAMTTSVPLLWFVYHRLRTIMGRDDALHAAAVAETSHRVIEFARAQPTLRTAGDDSISERLVEGALQHQHRRYRGMLLTGGAGIATFAGVVQIVLTVVIVLGAYLAVGGSLEPTTLIALLVLGVRFTEPIGHAGALGGGIAVAQTTLDQLDALDRVDILPEPTASATPKDWSVAFDDVTFGYGGAPVLDRMSFTAPAGRMTALVGPSGSGKTTITRLIARFHDPESGIVRIGGVPVPSLGTAVVEAAVAPVFQDVYLFDDTLLNNVWQGAPDAPRADVLEAARRARVDEIADRLPGGWDAGVGEGGSNLSGGERQRVSIARALLKDAPIVLLDEATAALDIGNEIAVGDAIDAIRADRTVLVVAHRLQTIMTADQIIMLDAAGGVTESGTHAELLTAGGPYARYWRDRVDATGWKLTAGTRPPSDTPRPHDTPLPRRTPPERTPR